MFFVKCVCVCLLLMYALFLWKTTSSALQINSHSCEQEQTSRGWEANTRKVKVSIWNVFLSSFAGANNKHIVFFKPFLAFLQRKSSHTHKIVEFNILFSRCKIFEPKCIFSRLFLDVCFFSFVHSLLLFFLCVCVAHSSIRTVCLADLFEQRAIRCCCWAKPAMSETRKCYIQPVKTAQEMKRKSVCSIEK